MSRRGRPQAGLLSVQHRMSVNTMGSSTPPVPYRVTVAQMSDAVQVVPTVNANGRPLVVLTQSFIPKPMAMNRGWQRGYRAVL